MSKSFFIFAMALVLISGCKNQGAPDDANVFAKETKPVPERNLVAAPLPQSAPHHPPRLVWYADGCFYENLSPEPGPFNDFSPEWNRKAFCSSNTKILNQRKMNPKDLISLLDKDAKTKATRTGEKSFAPFEAEAYLRALTWTMNAQELFRTLNGNQGCLMNFSLGEAGIVACTKETAENVKGYLKGLFPFMTTRVPPTHHVSPVSRPIDYFAADVLSKSSKQILSLFAKDCLKPQAYDFCK